jgi:hypothetical protein
MTDHSALPWTWHPKSEDQSHNGSIYRMERPGHAYAIAMQPQYVEDKQFAADAALIVKAVNNHERLVKALGDTLCELSHCAIQLAARGLPGHEGDSVSRAQKAARDILNDLIAEKTK